MEVLIATARTADVGHEFAKAQALVDHVVALTLESWREGADVVLWPEFMWMALEQFSPGLSGVAELFWNVHFPALTSELSVLGKCVVLGTVPFKADDGWRNRAVIFSDGTPHFQDKLCLTPWESDFRGGSGIHLWQLGKWKLGVLVCLDVEIPEHSVTLRVSDLDILLVPSATETLLGTERIARCASARAVELGCHVVVSHLVGTTQASSLIDENVGRLSCYSPSQTAFKRQPRIVESDIFTSGWESATFQFDRKNLDHMRRNKAETNPANLRI